MHYIRDIARPMRLYRRLPVLIFACLGSGADSTEFQKDLASFNQEPSFPCRSIRVFSTGELPSGQEIESAGVGVLFRLSAGRPLRVLVPAHLVEGGATLAGRCRNSTFPLRLRGSSPTLDLAVLEIETKPVEEFLYEAFVNDLEATRYIPSTAIFSEADADLHQRDPFKKNLRKIQPVSVEFPETVDDASVKGDAFRLQDKYWPGHSNPLIIQNAAIFPGMSGSPIFAHNRHGNPEDIGKPSFLGILVRTESGTPMSLALNYQDFRGHLESLDNGNDPWRRENSTGPRIEYQVEELLSHARRVRRMVFPKTDFYLEELCPTGRFSQTLEATSSGLNYSSTLHHYRVSGPDLPQPSPEARLSIDSLIRQRASCELEGVTTSKLSVHSVFFKNNRVHRATQLEDWFLLANENNQFYLKLEDFSPPVSAFTDYSRITSHSRWTYGSSLVPASNSGFVSILDPNAQVSYSHSVLQLVKRFQMLKKGVVDVASSGSEIIIDHKDVTLFEELDFGKGKGIRTAVDPVEVSMTIGARRIQGFFKFYGQKFFVDSPRVNLWSHQIELKDGILQIELAPQGRLLRIVWISGKHEVLQQSFSRSWYWDEE